MSDLKSDMCGEAKLLILGGSSFVGRHLFKRLGPGRAIATFNKTPITGGVRFDSLSMRLADIIDDPGDVTETVILLGDTNPKTIELGDARKSIDVWHGEAMTAFRRAHLKGDIPDVCKSCYKNGLT